jgi:YegS/Rv2252/BmrU family lipid kinase
MQRAIEIIINSNAGSMHATIEQKIYEAFHGTSCSALIHAVPGSMLTAVAAMAAKTADVVVAAGGDGTINAVAAGMYSSGKPLGVLPLGTLNHFSKDLGIPQDIQQAAHVVVYGDVQLVDVAFVNNRLFLNNSSIGLYPRMVRHRVRQQKELGRNKWIAMMIAGYSTLQELRRNAMRISIDDGHGVSKVLIRSPFVFIGNNVYETTLQSLGTRKGLTDGVLSMLMLHNPSRLRMMTALFHMLFFPNRHVPDITHSTAKGITIESRRSTLLTSFDGEIAKLSTPLRYTVAPASLPVMVPRGSSDSSSDVVR